MKKIIICSITVLCLIGCKNKNNNKKEADTITSDSISKTTIIEKPVVDVFADAETEPVTVSGDAADDPCIWINPKDVLKSTIIGTNKKEGLDVYDLNGKLLYRYKIGKVNNVDIRYGFSLNNKKYPLVTASNRTDNSISVLIVKEDGSLVEIAAKPLISELEPVYGLGMYKSAKSGKFYVFMVGKKGGVEQWELFESNGKVDGKVVRKFNIGSQGEGIVADDLNGEVYIGEENVALWRYKAEPDAGTDRREVISVKSKNMQADFEGVTLYDSGNGKGYIILSSQGNNSYAVFDRNSNEYVGTFKIGDGAIDGTIDTDGIDVTSVAIGKKYPKGFFLAQDYANTDKESKDTLNQNFKIVDWQKITSKLQLK